MTRRRAAMRHAANLARWRRFASTPHSLHSFTLAIILVLLAAGCGSSTHQVATTVASATTKVVSKLSRSGLHIDITVASFTGHHVDINVIYSSANTSSGEGSATIYALPCPLRRYRFIADASDLSSHERGTYSAVLTFGRAHLPPGVACDHQMPAAAAQHGFRLSVVGRGGNAGEGLDFHIRGYTASHGILTGRVEKGANNSLCPGSYELIAVLRGARRTAVMTYPFTVSHVVDRPEQLTCGA